MSDWGSSARTVTQRSVFSTAMLPLEALAGVRRRRLFALCLDFILVAFIAGLIWTVLLFLTLGLVLLLLPPIFPFVAFFYNGLTVSSWRMGTPGMLAMDLEMRMIDGTRVPFLNAAVHAVLLYISWMFPPILLVSLLMDDKRCLHDILAGIIITRRPPAY